MNDVIIVIIVILALLLILCFLLAYIVKRINLLSKNIFFDKMEQFDFLIGDKEEKVDELNNAISKKENDILNLEQKISEYESLSNIKKNDNEVVLPIYVDFEDDVITNYKAIKEKFNFDTKDIIEKFLKEKVSDNINYNVYVKVRSYFTYDVLYRLYTYQKNEQLLIINDLLNQSEKELLNEYLDKNNFNIKNFISSLDELIIKTSPEIKIFVGSENENYNFMDSHINTIYDANIIEGFKIFYKGIVYDYSI